MKDEHREVVGFLCRWCLLGLAWAGLAAGGYVGALAASPHQQTPRVFLSDEVYPVTLHPWMAGRLVPSPKDDPDVRLLVCCGEEVSVSAFWEGAPFSPPMERPAAGDFPAKVIGMPYVFLMFGGDGGKLRLVPKASRVFLIDCSLEMSAGGSDPALWTRALAAMRRRGSVALLHGGPAPAFETYRQDMRRRGFDDPVICWLGDKEASAGSLASARNFLCAENRRAELTTLVTDRPEMARAAAGMGFSASWVAPSGAQPPGGDKRVKEYAGLESFVRSIEAEPAGP